MRVVGLVSGGKDSCYNLINVVAEGHELVALANLRPKKEDNDELDSMMYQTVGHEVIDLYAEAMDLPLFRRDLEGQGLAMDKDYEPTEGDEVEDLYRLLKEVNDGVEGGVEGVAVGAILSDYQRVRVENVCQRLNMTPLAYLWQRDQDELIEEMVGCHIEAILIKVAALGLEPARHLGKTIEELKDHLRRMSGRFGNNVCGEGGEYESLTLDCPLFKKRIIIDKKETVMHSDDAFAPVAYLKVTKCHLVAKPGHKMSRRELLKLPVKNSMDLADEISRECDFDSDEEITPTTHIFSSSHSNGPLSGTLNTSPSSSSISPVINLSQSSSSPSLDNGRSGSSLSGSTARGSVPGTQGSARGTVKVEPNGTAPIVKIEVKTELDMKMEEEDSSNGSPVKKKPLVASSGAATSSAVNGGRHGDGLDMDVDDATEEETIADREKRFMKELENDQKTKVVSDKDFFYVTGIQGSAPPSSSSPTPAGVKAAVQSATRAAMERLTSALNAAGYSTSHVVGVNVYLRKMEDFKTVNEVYQTFFSGPPATRACVSLNLPPGDVLWLDAMGVVNVNQRQRHLHVSSLSHWAPANIGPYAQAVVVNDHVIFLSGQIALIPATLEIVSPDVRIQAALVMRHISRVLHVTAHGNAPGIPRNHINVNNVFSGICYVTKPSTVGVALREWKRVLRKQMNVKEKSSSNISQSMRLFVLVPELPKGASLEWQCSALLPLPTDGSRSSHFRETVCALGIFKIKIQILEHCTNASRNYSYSILATVAMSDGEERKTGINDDKLCTLIDFIVNNLKDFSIVFSAMRVYTLRCGPFRNSLLVQKLQSVLPTKTGSCQLVPVEGLWLDEKNEVVLALSQAI